MKKLLLMSFVIAFLFNKSDAFSQRNGNQKQFKSKSSGSYNERVFDNNATQNLIQNSDFQENYARNGNIGNALYSNSNEVVLEVRSLMNMKADRFLAVFNITQIGETAAKADELINSRIDAFTTALKQMGISEKDIYVDMIYLVPTFEFEMEKKFFSKTYNEVPTGFEMQKNIHVSFKDVNKVDDMVTLAAKNEIYDLVKLDFFVDNTESVYDTLRNKSVSCLNKKMASFKKLNLVLSDKFQILRESSYAIYPETQYPDYDAFVTQSLEAVKKNSGVTKIRKPKTVAYDQIPYNRYDIILNPAILEPVVQYVYTLQVKYTLDKPEPKSKNNYMIITPTGEVKKIELQ